MTPSNCGVMTVFPERSMKPYLPLTLIPYRPLLSGLYRPGGRFIHQYPAAATITIPATIAMRTRDGGRATALPLPAATGGAVDDATALGTALPAPSPRAALQLPQNLASAAFSNPHLHCIDCHLSVAVTNEHDQTQGRPFFIAAAPVCPKESRYCPVKESPSALSSR